MNALRGLEIGAGALLSLSAFADLFNSVVLPRPAINKFVLGRRLFTALWSGWRLVGDRLSQERREGWLGTFGPIAVLVMFGVWALAFVLGYGLIIDGLRDEMEPVPADLWESLYFSATTLVPLSSACATSSAPRSRSGAAGRQRCSRATWPIRSFSTSGPATTTRPGSTHSGRSWTRRRSSSAPSTERPRARRR